MACIKYDCFNIFDGHLIFFYFTIQQLALPHNYFELRDIEKYFASWWVTVFRIFRTTVLNQECCVKINVELPKARV